MKVLRVLFLLFAITILFSCATAPEIRINGVQLPNEVQTSIIHEDANNIKRVQAESDKLRNMKILWYYTRVCERTIKARGITEVIKERQPLDMEVPKTLSSDTSAVGINIIIYNPDFLRFRIVMLDPYTLQEKKIYEGIRDNYEVILDGPVVSDRQFRISARVDLIGKNGYFVVDSAYVGDLIYSVKSNKIN